MPCSRQLSALLIVFGLALASCGGDDDKKSDPQPTTTTVQTTTTEPPEQSDEESLRQLAEDWYEAVEAIYTGERDLDTAAEFIADPYLTGFEGQVEEFRRSGQQVQITGDSSHEIRSVDVAGDQATLVECVIDGDVLLDADGSVLNDSVQANLYSTAATRVGEAWRLSNREILSEVDGASSCPAE